MRARGAVRSGPRLLRRILTTFGTMHRGRLGVTGSIATNVVRQWRGTTKACRPAMGGDTGADDAVLVDIAAFIGEGAFLVERTSLASDQFSGFFLRHGLRGVSHIRDSYMPRLRLALVLSQDNDLHGVDSDGVMGAQHDKGECKVQRGMVTRGSLVPQAPKCVFFSLCARIWISSR